MANYIGTWRSNYFKVKDVEKFKVWVDSLHAELIGDEKKGYGFECGSNSDIGSIPNPVDDNDNEIDLYQELSKHLLDGEVAVLMEVGSEKMNYLVGYSIAVNHEGKTIEVSIDNIYQMVKDEFGIVPTSADY